jgi:hypothetical protein
LALNENSHLYACGALSSGKTTACTKETGVRTVPKIRVKKLCIMTTQEELKNNNNYLQ